MKKHQDLIAVLRSNKMRITPARRILLQYILDNQSRHLSMKDLQEFLDEKIQGVDRSSLYRNIDMFKKLDIIQELDLPNVGKRFQFVFDRKVHHFYICKACGKMNRGSAEVFQKIEMALKDTSLSAILYGYCSKCTNGNGRAASS